MRVSWFATGGLLPVDATAAGDRTRVETTWIVLRDSRGGIATQTLTVEIQ